MTLRQAPPKRCRCLTLHELSPRRRHRATAMQGGLSNRHGTTAPCAGQSKSNKTMAPREGPLICKRTAGRRTIPPAIIVRCMITGHLFWHVITQEVYRVIFDTIRYISDLFQATKRMWRVIIVANIFSPPARYFWQRAFPFGRFKIPKSDWFRNFPILFLR